MLNLQHLVKGGNYTARVTRDPRKMAMHRFRNASDARACCNTAGLDTRRTWAVAADSRAAQHRDGPDADAREEAAYGGGDQHGVAQPP